MTTNISIHRLLDEAFAGIAPSPAVQDLKEELRANLLARVEELEAAGTPAAEAARRAFDELGDVSALVGDAASDTTPAWARNRVRVAAGFVVRATIIPIAAAVALAIGVLALCGIVPGDAALASGLFAAFAFLIGWITGDSLAQETSQHFAMPRGRATGYGAGVALVLLGAATLALCWTGGPLWLWLAFGGLLLLAGIGALAGLGATQTNRTKPWALAYSAQWSKDFQQQHLGEWSTPSGDRFSRDPNAAARFGIYTVVIWVTATAIAVVLGFAVGWWWSALPWVAAFIVMMLVLARMLFVPGSDRNDAGR